jgi:hypothetical protein
MALPFATADDIALRWRSLTPDEEELADVLASDASALIRARFPGIDGQVDPTILTMVVAGMVKRAMIAPLDGVSQDSESVGPYSHSQSFSNPMRNVFLTAADLVLIQGYKPKGGTFAYGNTTTQTGWSWATVYGDAWDVPL